MTEDKDIQMQIDAVERRIDARLLRFWEKLEEVAETATVNGIAFGEVMDALIAHRNDTDKHRWRGYRHPGARSPEGD